MLKKMENSVQELTDHSITGHPPDYLVLYPSANDIGRLNTYQWCRECEACIQYIQVRYPDTKSGLV